jgi:hypothetical protein
MGRGRKANRHLVNPSKNKLIKENRILFAIWIAAAIMLAVATIYIRSTDQARQVESFIHHSEIKQL